MYITNIWEGEGRIYGQNGSDGNSWANTTPTTNERANTAVVAEDDEEGEEEEIHSALKEVNGIIREESGEHCQVAMKLNGQKVKVKVITVNMAVVVLVLLLMLLMLLLMLVVMVSANYKNINILMKNGAHCW